LGIGFGGPDPCQLLAFIFSFAGWLGVGSCLWTVGLTVAACAWVSYLFPFSRAWWCKDPGASLQMIGLV